MVTYFNTSDMVSFGEYLLSNKRRARIIEKMDNMEEEEIGISLEERLENVYHADLHNWAEDRGKTLPPQ